MTTRMALILFALIAGAILLDTLILDTGLSVEGARKGLELIKTVAFWR